MDISMDLSMDIHIHGNPGNWSLSLSKIWLEFTQKFRAVTRFSRRLGIRIMRHGAHLVKTWHYVICKTGST